ncbi:hypothetical protein NWFMUON74_49240 [Nocardia wallacei]|uniref:Uncharacterized protein n=1 Tax=Nocardia wallacei TaxID=480035 RepID=A0A7G1KPH5_9NOCA|nr:hypothetical protein NWFMUON74_49240 [Nocardia wallacei]
MGDNWSECWAGDGFGQGVQMGRHTKPQPARGLDEAHQAGLVGGGRVLGGRGSGSSSGWVVGEVGRVVAVVVGIGGG